MTEHYSTFLIAWAFLLLIGGWVLVNALIDLGAKRLRCWIATRGEARAESHSISRREITEG